MVRFEMLIIHWTTIGLLIALLLSVAWIDLATRIIPNWLCLVIAALGASDRLLSGPWWHLLESMTCATILFLFLLLLHARHLLGGGDVKLLVAMVIGLPLIGIFHLFMVMSLAGIVLSSLHLAMRHLPRPRLAPTGSWFLHRVYAVERWRILRHAPLPYGVAIACGGIFVLFNPGV